MDFVFGLIVVGGVLGVVLVATGVVVVALVPLDFEEPPLGRRGDTFFAGGSFDSSELGVDADTGDVTGRVVEGAAMTFPLPTLAEAPTSDHTLPGNDISITQGSG